MTKSWKKNDIKNRCQCFLWILALLFLIGFSACKNASSKSHSHPHDFANASWIGVQEKLPITDSLFYKDAPSPIFRKEFKIKAGLRSAVLSITSAGYYLATINGNRIGQNYLDPAWTNFKERVYYTRYDLTKHLDSSSNCLGVTLGNGFYNPLPLKMWGRINIRDALPTGNPIFIARLLLHYDNGSKEEIITNNSWTYSYGPIRRNDVYLGEVYDANYEIENWNTSDYNDELWKAAIECTGPGGKLEESFFPPIQVTDIVKPVAISNLSKDKYLVDMGVNFTGLYRIQLRGQSGDSIAFRFGERIYPNGELNPMTTVAGQIKKAGRGGPGSPNIAWQTDTYIFGNDSVVWYSPEFTFHTYRYMEITGLKESPPIENIKGLALNTNVEHNNHFSCSSSLINSIQEVTVRTFLANLIGVQSDCPAREKFGYGGDINATSEAFIYNLDMQNFYRKTIYDWIDAMNDSCFVDTAPFVGIKYCGLSWESAFLTTQYHLFLYYNDTAIIHELYDRDLEWMKKVERLHPNGIVETGLSDHESLEPVPVQLTGTAHYLQCARIMKTFASYMGDVQHEKHFERLKERLRKILQENFWNKPVIEPINKQTLFSTLLYHNIIPKDEVASATDSLLASLGDDHGHFKTGIFGTKYILEALSNNNHIQTVFDIVNSPDYPGWGYMVSQGATTLWETWKESDDVYSNCHPMFGSVTEWFYRWLGGIRPHPDYPGFEKFIINPFLPDGLDEVSSSYYSPYGKILSNWKRGADGNQNFEVEIPAGSSARFKLPESEKQNISFNDNSSGNSFVPKSVDGKDQAYDLPPGSYTIVVQ